MRQRTKTPIRLDQTVSGILLRLGGLAAIAILVAIGVNVGRTVLSQSADRYVSASEGLSLAHAGMLDEETGLRGFLETGLPSFLDPYHSGGDELEQGDAELQQAVAGDSRLLNDYVAPRVSQSAWLSGWADNAVAEQPQAATTATFVASGKVLFDSYRARETTLNTSIDASAKPSPLASHCPTAVARPSPAAWRRTPPRRTVPLG